MLLRSLDLNLLRVFDVLMKERSVTQAAQHLNITQPSASNALERLRQSTGDQLLERVGNVMVPTQFANDFWPSVTEALQVIEDGLARIAEFSPHTLDKKVKIGMDAFCISFLAPALFRRLAEEAPLAQVEILPMPPHLGDDDMIRDHCDVIIGPTWRSDPKIAKKVLFKEELVVVVRTGHPFTQNLKAFGPKSYAMASHLTYSDVGIVKDIVDFALRQHGLHRKVVASVPFFPAIADILRSTDCVLTVGRALGEHLCETGGLTLLDPPIDVPGFEVSMLWAVRNTNSISHTWLRKVCSEVAYSSEKRSTSAAVFD